MLPVQGYLRDTVSVVWLPNSVDISFSLWGIELPQRIIDSSKSLGPFLRREIPSDEVIDSSSAVQNLIGLLSHQGCLIAKHERPSYDLTEIKSIYSSFCNEWYGRYYAHPVWDALRQNPVPIELIRQWLSRTYFLSRFAGVTASLAATNAPCSEIQFAFLKSAIEEYSHCEDYYYPPAALFPPSMGYSLGVAPLPSFIAFDQQMCVIAKKDWLAHIFVALIQEKTAQFKESADELYSRIEQQLALPSLLNGWRKHIAYDAEHSHENDIDSLFDLNLSVSSEDLKQSFREAGLTIDFLIDALDDILRLGSHSINPRALVEGLHLDRHHVLGIRCLEGIEPYSVASSSIVDLPTELATLVDSTRPGHQFLCDASPSLMALLLHAIASTVTDCLGNCEEHNQIVKIGHMVKWSNQSVLPQSPSPIVVTKASRIFKNHFARQASRPVFYLFSLLVTARLIEAGMRHAEIHPRIYDVIELLEQLLRSSTSEYSAKGDVAKFLNEGIYLVALMEYVWHMADREMPDFSLTLGQ